MIEHTVDVLDRVEELREQADQIEETQDELVERLKEDFDGFEDVPQKFQESYEEFEEEIVSKRGKADLFEKVVDEYGGSEWTLTTVTLGQLGKIQDQVSDASFDFDVERGEVSGGMPKQGYGRNLTLEECIVEQPPDAPTTKDPRTGQEVPEPEEYPSELGLWLFEKANAINTTGDIDMGNSSLQERMSE